ncbi:MAG TPA: UDP-glucose/GDP-mannose dehydrogenase family protein [Candidatus Bathyarchaeia archaeon]|nr:UDP-glucose/GDP-mannose dehydrogenase family protein [Candidatus Bathyarchaeia archaeon]
MSEKLIGPLEGKRIAVLGLAFKKDTDDIREAASLRVTEKLLEKKAVVVAYDPKAILSAKRVLEDSVEYAQYARSALKDTDCCIVMNEWDQFKKLKVRDFTDSMTAPNVVDARRNYEPEQFKEIRMEGVGL